MSYTSDRTGAEVDATLDAADVHIAEVTTDPHLPAASQVEAEAGTEAAQRAFSPLRVAQAIAALGGGGSLGYDANGNLFTEDSNTVMPTSMTNGLYLTSGVAPTDNPTDMAMLWSADQNAVAGTASLNFESEDGFGYTFGTLCGLGTLLPTRELDVSGDVIADSYETSGKAIIIPDSHTGVVTTNDLAFPSDANVITLPVSTINTVSGVTAGAVYVLVALGAVTLTDGATIVCRGGNIVLAANESVMCVGLSATSISVCTKT